MTRLNKCCALTIFGLLIMLVTACARAETPPDRQIVLTFDDLPMTTGRSCEAAEIRQVTQGITQTLAKHKLPAAGFATPGRDCISPKLLGETLKAWLEIGAVVGNHTATHPDLNRVPIKTYLDDINRAQQLIEASIGTTQRWFRPPYLHMGDQRDKKRALERFLVEQKYRLAPVTIDNQEWVYASVYASARSRGDEHLASRVADAYILHLQANLAYYEQLSVRLFDREIPQILLLHANRLNAEQLGRVIGLLKSRGYRFVDLASAVRDPAFKRKDHYLGPKGLSWLQRWAVHIGLPLAPEPREDDWVAEEFRGLSTGRAAATQASSHRQPAQASTHYRAVELPNTEQRSYRSRVNGIEYRLYLSLPKDYRGRTDRYPVIYLLDADYAFAITRNIVEHLSERGHLPAAIIVGIAYANNTYRLNRTRDYTPTRAAVGGYGPEEQAVSGGGPKFLDFLDRELIPLIEAEYRAKAQRVLVGHSFGGLFAAWTLLTRPQLFEGYIIVSPSLWYDDHMLLNLALKPSHANDLAARVFLTVGKREVNDERNMPVDLQRFAETLGERSSSQLELRWAVKPNETHHSIFPGAVSDGLRFVLRGR
jgi:hypothetical protein